MAMLNRDDEAAELFEFALREHEAEKGVLTQARAMYVMLLHRNASAMVNSGWLDVVADDDGDVDDGYQQDLFEGTWRQLE